jgi:hypothetical protein
MTCNAHRGLKFPEARNLFLQIWERKYYRNKSTAYLMPGCAVGSTLKFPRLREGSEGLGRETRGSPTSTMLRHDKGTVGTFVMAAQTAPNVDLQFGCGPKSAV